MALERVDCVVIGAGVIGLACARALALRGREVVVLEATGLIGSQTSARNSEVIHAGIYYTPGWYKARFCIDGKQALYRYLTERDIAHKQCGKLIVATSPAQAARLDEIIKNAAAAGCDDLQTLSKSEITRLEPAVHAVAGILSPSTGILDSHAFMLSLQGEVEDHTGTIAFESPVLEVACDNGLEIAVGGRDPIRLRARAVINAAGLEALPLARRFKGFPAQDLPIPYYAKGNYFSLTGKAPFKHLIYPVPGKAGLGIHLTLDMAGQARFGPDVEWVDRIDYALDSTRAEMFYPAIRSYWPDLKDGALQPAYTGIRPKLQAPGDAARDFLIQGARDHGVAGLVNLFGIESPGLTGSLAIADYVAGLATAH